MKLSFLLAASFFFAVVSCERHEFEETKILHESHGSHGAGHADHSAEGDGHAHGHEHGDEEGH